MGHRRSERGLRRGLQSGRRRSRRRFVHRLAFFLAALVAVATVLGSGRVLLAVLGLMFGLTMVLVVAVLYTVVQAGRWLSRRLAPALPVAVGPPPPVDWAGAQRRFRHLAAEYAGYECDPLAVLRLPALADVNVPATARFVHAFAEAQALDTDNRPPEELAVGYAEAVDRARRAWRAAQDSADRIRLAGLSPTERASVQRVIKLLTVAADTGHEGERSAAYAKAREELTRLEKAGTIVLPRLAHAALDNCALGRLPAA
ncbi:MAG: hypothetical protein JO100_05835 [Pseudonocardia sp.]|nr:hypothetical protein [Pseudonocardia sp.]